MNKTIDKSGKFANVVVPTYSRTSTMPEQPKGDGIVRFNIPEGCKTPEEREAFDAIETHEDFMGFLKKYSPEEYEVLANTTKEDNRIMMEMVKFINTLTYEDYYRYITGEGRTAEDLKTLEMLMDRDQPFRETIEYKRQVYEKLGFDNNAFMEQLLEEKAISERLDVSMKEQLQQHLSDFGGILSPSTRKTIENFLQKNK